MAKAKQQRRRYSDDERSNALAALAANGGNYKRTARELGIPVKTLKNWAKGVSHPEVSKDAPQKRADMAQALREIAWKLADAIPGKIDKAPLNQVAVAMGIAIDKAQLLDGRPTAIEKTEAEVKLAKLNDNDVEAIAAIIDRADAGNGPARDGPAKTAPVHVGDDA